MPKFFSYLLNNDRSYWRVHQTRLWCYAWPIWRWYLPVCCIMLCSQGTGYQPITRYFENRSCSTYRETWYVVRANGNLLENQETLKYLENHVLLFDSRDVSRIPAISKMELLVTLSEFFVTETSILAVVKVLDQPLSSLWKKKYAMFFSKMWRLYRRHFWNHCSS